MFPLQRPISGGPDVTAGPSAAVNPKPAIPNTVATIGTVGIDTGVVPSEVLNSNPPSIVGAHAGERHDNLPPHTMTYEGE